MRNLAAKLPEDVGQSSRFGRKRPTTPRVVAIARDPAAGLVAGYCKDDERAVAMLHGRL
jgi:hypothetical protein